MRAYLDHNATSPLLPEALEAMLPFLRDGAANPSSTHRDGQRSRLAVEEAREEVAALAGSAPSEVVFTSGGTEADNAAIAGTALAAGVFPTGARMVATTIEHPAVHRALRGLEARGWSVARVEPMPSGVVSPDAVLGAIDERTLLVSAMHVNNETGSIQPVEILAERCAERGIPFHTDAVQALGKVPLCETASLLSLSAHKIGGPHGVGALIVRRGARLEPILRGGPQERRRRAGTENVAGIVGFGAAARIARSRMGPFALRATSLRDLLERRLLDRFPGVQIHGGDGPRVASTSCFSIPGVVGSDMQVALDLEGFSVSTGTACASGTIAPSYVLRALGLPESVTRAALRVSFGWGNTEDEVERLVAAIARTADRFMEKEHARATHSEAGADAGSTAGRA